MTEQGRFNPAPLGGRILARSGRLARAGGARFASQAVARHRNPTLGRRPRLLPVRSIKSPASSEYSLAPVPEQPVAQPPVAVPRPGGISEEAAKWLFLGELGPNMLPMSALKQAPRPATRKVARSAVPRPRLEEGPSVRSTSAGTPLPRSPQQAERRGDAVGQVDSVPGAQADVMRDPAEPVVDGAADPAGDAEPSQRSLAHASKPAGDAQPAGDGTPAVTPRSRSLTRPSASATLARRGASTPAELRSAAPAQQRAVRAGKQPRPAIADAPAGPSGTEPHVSTRSALSREPPKVGGKVEEASAGEKALEGETHPKPVAAVVPAPTAPSAQALRRLRPAGPARKAAPKTSSPGLPEARQAGRAEPEVAVGAPTPHGVPGPPAVSMTATDDEAAPPRIDTTIEQAAESGARKARDVGDGTPLARMAPTGRETERPTVLARTASASGAGLEPSTGSARVAANPPAANSSLGRPSDEPGATPQEELTAPPADVTAPSPPDGSPVTGAEARAGARRKPIASSDAAPVVRSRNEAVPAGRRESEAAFTAVRPSVESPGTTVGNVLSRSPGPAPDASTDRPSYLRPAPRDSAPPGPASTAASTVTPTATAPTTDAHSQASDPPGSKPTPPHDVVEAASATRPRPRAPKPTPTGREGAFRLAPARARPGPAGSPSTERLGAVGLPAEPIGAVRLSVGPADAAPPSATPSHAAPLPAGPDETPARREDPVARRQSARPLQATEPVTSASPGSIARSASPTDTTAPPASAAAVGDAHGPAADAPPPGPARPSRTGSPAAMPEPQPDRPTSTNHDEAHSPPDAPSTPLSEIPSATPRAVSRARLSKSTPDARQRLGATDAPGAPELPMPALRISNRIEEPPAAGVPDPAPDRNERPATAGPVAEAPGMPAARLRGHAVARKRASAMGLTASNASPPAPTSRAPASRPSPTATATSAQVARPAASREPVPTTAATEAPAAIPVASDAPTPTVTGADPDASVKPSPPSVAARTTGMPRGSVARVTADGTPTAPEPRSETPDGRETSGRAGTPARFDTLRPTEAPAATQQPGGSEADARTSAPARSPRRRLSRAAVGGPTDQNPRADLASVRPLTVSRRAAPAVERRVGSHTHAETAVSGEAPASRMTVVIPGNTRPLVRAHIRVTGPSPPGTAAATVAAAATETAPMLASDPDPTPSHPYFPLTNVPDRPSGHSLARAIGVTRESDGSGRSSVVFPQPPSRGMHAGTSRTARPLDRQTIESEPVSLNSHGPDAVPSAAAEQSIYDAGEFEELYDRVLSRLRRDLIVERERRGDLSGAYFR